MLREILDRLLELKNQYMQSNDIFDHIEELCEMTAEELKVHGIVGKMSKSSDPTLHHCQHKIADMNKYPYCPECGERV